MNTVVSVFGVEPRRIGGNENFARELSLQLGQHGWRSVLCFLTEPPADVREYLSLPNVSIEILEDSWRPSFAATKKLIKILRQYRPQILHLHFVGFLNLFSWTGRLISAKRIFFTDQASRPENYVATRSAFWKRILGRLINWPLTKVIGVSGYNRRCMTTLDLLPADRFECIYNSVDLSRVERSAERAASFRQTHAIPSSRKLITQVSWLIPEKGIPDLLHATALVVAKDKNVQLALVGDGAHRDEYQQLATQLGLNGHVTWAGLIQDPFAEGVYDAADIVCQVSRWQEAFGWVLAEAMASKKPVIGTTVGGIPEIIQDGKSGYLVEPGSPERLAERLTQLLNDEELRRQMGEAGCEIVKQKFELQKNVARLLELYGISPRG
ncbi:MAG TPA: glycosyltransferase family 4 protein [Pyrinomonadaceae bacterium]|nr:glycosyltransferase family 4 protein [Pyrinomonadaceae bacterium]